MVVGSLLHRSQRDHGPHRTDQVLVVELGGVSRKVRGSLLQKFWVGVVEPCHCPQGLAHALGRLLTQGYEPQVRESFAHLGGRDLQCSKSPRNAGDVPRMVLGVFCLQQCGAGYFQKE